VFVGWSGGCSGTGACVVTNSASREATALFKPATVAAGSSTITVTQQGSGSVEVTTPGGTQECTVSACSYTAANGTTMTFRGLGQIGEWDGGCSGGATVCQVVVSKSTTVNVAFSATIGPAVDYGMLASRSGGGTITSVPPGVTCGQGNDCAAAFGFDVKVQLTAAAAPGFEFVHWTGDCSGGATCALTMDASHQVGALFRTPTHTVIVNTAGTGSGSVTGAPVGLDCGDTCSFAYPNGTQLTLTAKAKSGSHFTGWNGLGCAAAPVCRAAINADATVGARFDRCALAVVPRLQVLANGAKQVAVRLGLVGGARINVAVYRHSRLLGSRSRRAPAGTSAFRLAIQGGTRGLIARVRITDLCGRTRTLTRMVSG
jgi:hypothetical protein